MFLRSLSMKGFKSFADATILEMEPGVTVVVGPNGSGKSNVVDAIGWVLGAQAPSAVRSQKMDDVIFAGTQKRPALGRAEVALTIDNSAGLLPIEFNEVTLSRTLFRNGDSEYAINGVPCRLLDLQELLSDSGVGRQQHVIISQGQIDAVLNARPEDRRLIIEEAAGVLKFRRRKEKAERRLTATEGNLTRLQDLLREVRRQLRPLEKQADAARRHGDVVGELTTLRVHLAGRDLQRLQGRLVQGQRTSADLAGREGELRARLRSLDAEVMATEARLGAMGGDDLGDALVRFESLREKARGLAALLTERRRGIDRDRAASVDQGVTASLEADAASIAQQLAEVTARAEALVETADAVGRDESDLAAARDAFAQEWSEGAPVATGAAAEVRGELAAVRAGLDRSQSEATRGQQRLVDLEARLARLVEEHDRRDREVAEGEGAVPGLEAEVAEAGEAQRLLEAAVQAAEETARAAEADRHRWSARAEALASALAEARAAAGAEALAEVEGIVGTLLDVVRVDSGWEQAFEAAAGEAIGSVVVESVDRARDALAALQAGDLSGAVLALGTSGTPAALAAIPAGATALRGHVHGTRPGVDGLLDVLVGGAVVAEAWAQALDLVLANPAQVVVTRDGDRFGPTGWRVGNAGRGATGAALEEAQERAAVAGAAGDAAGAALGDVRLALGEARRVAVERGRSLDALMAAARSAAEARTRLARDRDEATEEVGPLREHVVELGERARRDTDRVAELEARLPALEAEELAVAEQGRAMAEARSRIDERAKRVAAARNELDVAMAGLDQRRQVLERRGEEVDARLARHSADRAQAAERRTSLDRRAAATEALTGYVGDRLTLVESELGGLRERRRVQTDATREVSLHLEATRKQRSTAEVDLQQVRELAQRAELEAAEVRLRIETATEAVRRDLDIEPEAAMAAPDPELAEGVSATARVRELERDLRIMGPINPLALQEFAELQERHEFLQSQLEDVKSSRRDLAKVIAAIDAEIVSVFAAAFAEVSQHYAELFETLFPGGKGRLKLTDPNDLLGTGIEVEARPSGKNVRKLSLLSGGERSLVALAYLFAVFRARPSPFYVMDEVEAALDDVNLSRFLGLVQEFRDEAQLIVVSHQKRTMEAADCLYGVTMQPGGSSRVVSEKVKS